MSTYDELLKEARANASAFALTAREYIPRMYNTLRAEDPNLSPEDVGDRIRKDCIGIWSRRTILAALPDEAKDPKKQKAGRLSQKEHDLAAFSAASEAPNAKKEIEITTEGDCIDSNPYQTENGLNIGTTEIGLQYKQSYDTLPFELSVPSTRCNTTVTR